MTNMFCAEPDTQCDFCEGKALFKLRIMRVVKGTGKAGRVASGFFSYSCQKCLPKAERTSTAGIAPTRAK